MNNFIKAVKALDFLKVKALVEKDARWISYVEEGGKNALHYLGSVKVGDDTEKALSSVEIFQWLCGKGMDLNAIHEIKDKGCDIFPATPLWYAYARGRNKKLYTWLLEAGAKPDNCMFAIAWNDDAEAAALFRNKGADIRDNNGKDTPFLSAIHWKRFKVADWFLENGADINARGDDDMTALHCAVKRKYEVEHIQFLMNHGADIHLKNEAGISPLELAQIMRLRKITGILSHKP